MACFTSKMLQVMTVPVLTMRPLTLQVLRAPVQLSSTAQPEAEAR